MPSKKNVPLICLIPTLIQQNLILGKCQFYMNYDLAFPVYLLFTDRMITLEISKLPGVCICRITIDLPSDFTFTS